MIHLYIAGPYTNPDPIINTHAAIKVATALYETGEYVPHVPHLTLLWHMVTPRPIEFWYDLDEHHLSRCEAITRLPGESSGADREVVAGEQMGLDYVWFESFPHDVQSIWLDRFVRPEFR